MSNSNQNNSEREVAVCSQISIVKNYVTLLANNVNSVLGTDYSQIFLETIYTPFIGHMVYFTEIFELKSCDSIFMNFSEVYDYIVGDEAKSNGVFDRDIEWRSGSYDLVTLQHINIYEKIIYTIFGISYLEMKYKQCKEKIDRSPRLDLRLRLREIIDSEKNIFSDKLIDFLPYSLFEGLKEGVKKIDYPSAKVHWLGQIHNEQYLLYLAYLKDRGVSVIGEPHGGGFSQVLPILGNEIAEMILSDKYHTPRWTETNNVFPNTRASRNLFLNIKDCYKNLFNKNKSKLLVCLGVFYKGTEPPFNKSFVKNGVITDFYTKQIKDLQDHFTVPFDFKMHPTQVGGAEIENSLKQIYPACEIIKEGSFRQISHNYDGVIYFDFFGTGIIELASTNVAQYVYLGPELSIAKDYESFLWNTKLSSTRGSIQNGAYVKIDNKKYRAAYGASYFYPFYFSKLIKKLKINFGKYTFHE